MIGERKEAAVQLRCVLSCAGCTSVSQPRGRCFARTRGIGARRARGQEGSDVGGGCIGFDSARRSRSYAPSRGDT